MDKSQFVNWFRSASPYIRIHRGRTFVIQVSDRVLRSDGFTALVHDLALLASLGIRLVLVFGARVAIEAALDEKKLDSRRHNGIRITDPVVMGVVKEVAGRLLLEIQAGLSMGLGNTPMSNSAIRVNTGNYISARPLGVIDGVDFELTGVPRYIDADAMTGKLNDGEIIVLPPLGYSVTGEAYNLSAVALAADTAIALQADKLICLVEQDELSALTDGWQAGQLDQEEARELLARLDEQSGGYQYLKHALEACINGVERVHLLNREEDGAILNELFTRDGSGLMVSSSAYDVTRQAGAGDIGGILDLIEPHEQQGSLVKRSREKLELEVDHFTILIRDGVIIGCVGLYPYPEEGMGEVACLVVHPDYQDTGHGNRLLDEVEKEAREQSLDNVFVLTTQAQHWFLERGFQEASLEDLPMAKQGLYNYQRNSKILIKLLN
ncbi:MAG: amino-acid N-acetyltransferase [Gammaproteobacteria bacterium]|nr:amino-acid N-acetyltransferase [Gammaproteobacteria bacterium]